MVVGAARELNADVTDTNTLAQRIADLGEPLCGKLEPTGYPALEIRIALQPAIQCLF